MDRLSPIEPFEPIRSDAIPSGGEWLHQIKWDGVRVLVYADRFGCRLFNRRLRERTMQYPELSDIRAYCSVSSVILDGEVIALSADGKPSFHEVMRRDGVRSEQKAKAAAKQVAIAYMVFDVLFIDGIWVTDKPLVERQRMLKDIVRPNGAVQLVSSHADGEALFALMKREGMEGIVSKTADSLYTPGAKDGRWRKVKLSHDMIAVIGGIGFNGRTPNALLTGLYDDAGRLHFIGRVGPGRFTAVEWRTLIETLRPTLIPDCPFANRHDAMKGAAWVVPRFTVKLRYMEWRRAEGRTLRQPTLEALTDVPPESCMLPE